MLKLCLKWLAAGLLVFAFGFFVLRPRLMAALEPDVCALCDSPACTAPCLMDLATGEVQELQGIQVPGKFQYLVLGDAIGTWDSDSQTT